MHPLQYVLETEGALFSSEWTLGEDSAGEGALFRELILPHWYQYPGNFLSLFSIYLLFCYLEYSFVLAKWLMHVMEK